MQRGEHDEQRAPAPARGRGRGRCRGGRRSPGPRSSRMILRPGAAARRPRSRRCRSRREGRGARGRCGRPSRPCRGGGRSLPRRRRRCGPPGFVAAVLVLRGADAVRSPGRRRAGPSGVPSRSRAGPLAGRASRLATRCQRVVAGPRPSRPPPQAVRRKGDRAGSPTTVAETWSDRRYLDDRASPAPSPSGGSLTRAPAVSGSDPGCPRFPSRVKERMIIPWTQRRIRTALSSPGFCAGRWTGA